MYFEAFAETNCRTTTRTGSAPLIIWSAWLRRSDREAWSFYKSHIRLETSNGPAYDYRAYQDTVLKNLPREQNVFPYPFVLVHSCHPPALLEWFDKQVADWVSSLSTPLQR